MAHELPKLTYAFNALEPHIDAKTMEIHHGKHHQAYVNNLNAALDKHPELHGKSICDLVTNIASVPEDIRTAVRNNGGGHWNHSMFWSIMGPGKGGEPTGDLAAAINGAFGNFTSFKEKLTQAGMTRFGSGWAWLGVKDDGKLCVCSTPNQDNPMMKGVVDCVCTPILGVDVWEHAYYLNYQNRRNDYLAAWWNIVDWNAVATRFAKAKK